MALRALARVNLAAIERNVALLRSRLTGEAELCAVVKADGYGHGAVPVAQAALAGGASWLAVASAQEALELRSAGIDARLLVMGAISAEELPIALAARAELTAWTEEFADAVAAAGEGSTRMHVKIDTGMGRLGTRDVGAALRLVERLGGETGAFELVGVMTHFATADDDLDFAAEQLGRFAAFVEQVRAGWPHVVAHAANSAATLKLPASHLDLVRCGIAIYGCDPSHQDPALHGLEPALELSSYVAAVKRARAGESVGYGRRFIADRDTWIATLPIGYGDGIRRGLTNNCEVLVAGGRYPLVGTVSMDNITLELGDRPLIEIGERATIIGESGSERQTAEDLARRLQTINYEVLCAISARVPREYHRDGGPP